MTWTRLHDACQHQDKNVVIKLSEDSAEEAKMMDDHGSTPLHIAAWSNPPSDVIQALVTAYCQAVTKTDILGNTPLHIAVSRPETSPVVIKALLDASSIAPTIANKEGLLPLHMACRHAPANEHVIGLLIEANPNALHRHIKMGAPVRRKRDPLPEKKECNHFVTDTAGKVNLNSPYLWFDSYTQIRDGAYPLHMAVTAGAPQSVVEILIKAYEESLLLTNKHGETPLHLALANHADDEMIGVLLGTWQAVLVTLAVEKLQGNLPMHTAATNGCSVAVAKMLLHAHPNSIHEKNSQFKTPLDLAMESGHCADDVMLLLEISDQAEDIPE